MRIIGIDPGTARTGFGVVEKKGGEFIVVDYGLIETKKDLEPAERLEHIFAEVTGLIKRHGPDVLAIERLFFNRNVTTAMSVGEARGVIILSAARAGIRAVEYMPLQIKKALTGDGRAEKKQVQEMVRMMLKLPEIPKPDDVADALAIAVCHAGASRFEQLARDAGKGSGKNIRKICRDAEAE
ncbi:MAG TPA: crossover junction endodeoxyribonuclease RuvC [bacterium]|mgnify:CR=1 FL=1|nr:crossover junction endodeoxyribonuclease RuvC [bacterium]